MNEKLLLEESYAICKTITLGHYENFPVASLFIPAKLRNDIYAVYAFARTADDSADETVNKDEALHELQKIRKKLEVPDEAGEKPSIYHALKHTIEKHDLPLKYFTDLVDAFTYDVNHEIFRNETEMLDYCSRSAAPVGRIILWLYGLHKPPLIELSDQITAALQLANFWQDISVDKLKGRIYIPLDILEKFGLEKTDLFNNIKKNEKRELISYLSEKTMNMFYNGKKLLPHLPLRLRWEIKFTISGGETIIAKVSELGSDVFNTRPVIKTGDWVKILFGWKNV